MTTAAAAVALVHVDTRRCPACSTVTIDVTWAEPALLRHGGYGHTITRTIRHCPACGWTLDHTTGSSHPTETAS